MKFNKFKTHFYKRDVSKHHLIAQIKIEHDNFDELSKFTKQMIKGIPSFKTYFWKIISGDNHLPKNYEDLGFSNFRQFKGDPIQEMNWHSLVFVKEHEKLNLFLNYRQIYEDQLITGQYKSARKTLKTITDDICVSLWGIEQTLILDQFENGTQKNWKTRNEYQDENYETNLKIFSSLFSLKAEEKVSFFQYNDEFNNWIQKQTDQATFNIEAIIEYFTFKSNFFAKDDNFDFTTILTMEQNYSLIDRYLVFVRTIQFFEKNTESTISKIKILLNSLLESINDPILKNILISMGEFDDLNLTDSDLTSLKIIDEYTSGNYSNCQYEIKQLLTKDKANQIELLEIYVKSLIESGESEFILLNSDCLLNDIARNYLEVLTKSSKTITCIIDLLKIANVFNNSAIGIHIYSFIINQLGWNPKLNYCLTANTSSIFVNPKIIEFIPEDKKIRLAKWFIENQPKSSTFKTYYYFLTTEKIDKNGNNTLKIPDNKYELYLIRSLISKNKHEEAIIACEQLRKVNNLSIVNDYELTSYQFQCCLELELYRSGLLIFVDAYLRNSHLTYRCNTDELQRSVIKGKFKNIGSKDRLIELPIFFNLTDGTKNMIKQAYEQVLEANNCKKPSEFLEYIHFFDKEKFIYFLRSIAVPEIIQLSKHISSTQEVYKERILVCQFLESVDKENDREYKNEIADITKRNTITQVVGRIDQGKIYVNEDKIKRLFLSQEYNSETPKLSLKNERIVASPHTFQRMLELKEFEEIYEFRNSILIFDSSKNQYKLGGSVGFDVFKEMFLEIRDWFVMNNEYGYGLDAYLSTRIRHGTLPNHIRSVFETYYLVTSQTDGRYSENEYWSKHLSIETEEISKIQSCLAQFSGEVDEISLFLKDILIQYKTEERNENEDALFNFCFDDFDLLLLFNQIDTNDSYEKFIDFCISTLWKKTEKSLDIIQNKLNNEIKEKYVIKLEVLEKELTKIESRNKLSELLNNITSCKTEIQALLSNIAKWFTRADSSFDGKYQLETLIDASIQIIKNTNSKYDFNIAKDIQSKIAIKGEYHEHFIDLINIFLQNMITHSLLSVDELNASIKTKEYENTMKLEFSNTFSREVLTTELQKTLSTIKYNWNNMDRNVSFEKNSGFPKINKILRSDLGRQTCDFDYSIAENNLKVSLIFDKYFE